MGQRIDIVHFYSSKENEIELINQSKGLQHQSCGFSSKKHNAKQNMLPKYTVSI